MPEQNPIRKMRKKKSLPNTIAVIIFIILVSAAGVYFLLPGLANPINLGVKPSNGIYGEAVKKITEAKESSSANSEDNTVSLTLTGEEFTSLITQSPGTGNEIKDFQVKVNKDNTLETSATISTSYLLNDVLEGKYSRGDLKKALPMLEALPEQMNLYAKVAQDSNNGSSGFNLKSVNVMGIPIPESILNSEYADVYTSEGIQIVLEQFSERAGVKFSDIQLIDGSLQLKGQN